MLKPECKKIEAGESKGQREGLVAIAGRLSAQVVDPLVCGAGSSVVSRNCDGDLIFWRRPFPQPFCGQSALRSPFPGTATCTTSTNRVVLA